MIRYFRSRLRNEHEIESGSNKKSCQISIDSALLLSSFANQKKIQTFFSLVRQRLKTLNLIRLRVDGDNGQMWTPFLISEK